MKKNIKLTRRTKESHELSDRDLMLKVQKGDHSSFKILYFRFVKQLRKYTYKHTHSLSVAEDLTQEILLKIFQFSRTYNPRFEVSTWIWAIAKNTVYDYFRKSILQNQNVNLSQDLSTINSEYLISTDTAESLLLDESERKTEKTTFQDILQNLSERQKKVLFLRLVKNSSYLEISKLMNISLSAVKSLVNRAKSNLIKSKSHSQNHTH